MRGGQPLTKAPDGVSVTDDEFVYHDDEMFLLTHKPVVNVTFNLCFLFFTPSYLTTLTSLAKKITGRKKV